MPGIVFTSISPRVFLDCYKEGSLSLTVLDLKNELIFITSFKGTELRLDKIVELKGILGEINW